MVLLPALAGEGHAEELQKFPGLLIGLRRRHDADLQPAETVDLVVIDLGERELLAHPETVVAAPVERLGRDARERQNSEALHEVPHPLAAEGHLGADGVARPETELGDGALCLRDNRLLARDEGQVADGRVERLGIRERLAEPDVDHDLLESRHLHRVRIGELLGKRRDDLVGVASLQVAAHAPFTSTGWPQRPQARTRVPLSRRRWWMRVGWSQRGQTNMTFPTAIGSGFSTMPPCCICGTRSFWFMRGRGFVCRFEMFSPWTTTRYGVPSFSGRSTRSTVPRFPASLPPSTRIVSPLRISGTLVTRGATARAISEHLRRERDDLHVVPIAKLARHGAEDPRAPRVALVVDEDGRVLVKPDVAAIWPAVLLRRANHDGSHLSLIHISEPTRLGMISYAVFCLKKQKK